MSEDVRRPEDGLLCYLISISLEFETYVFSSARLMSELKCSLDVISFWIEILRYKTGTQRVQNRYTKEQQ